MADVQPSERVVLKILNGVQAGSEVSLANGEYLIGSGADDDIQLIDVSLKAGFAKLKLATGMIYIRGGTGSLVSKNGLISEAGSVGWQEIEPLDVVTAGTTRFALGPPSAQWATIADMDAPSAKPKKTSGKPSRPGTAGASRRPLVFAVLGLAVAGLLVLRWLLPDSVSWIAPRSGGPGDLETARAAIAPFEFARGLNVRQEVDGAIYLTGYVEANVERRAVQGAIEKTGIPVRMRIGVLEVLRNELNNLVAAEKVSVKGTVTADGVAVLDGVILDETRASLFANRISGDVIGIARVDSNIKTAPMLFAEIEKLARTSQIDTKVVFRLDKDVVEANGIIAIDKVDTWTGFLQSYSRRFGQSIGLRSYVQLQNAAGTLTPAPLLPGTINPVLIGPQAGLPAKGDILVDLDKLRRGQFDINDVLARPDADAQGPNLQSQPAVNSLVLRPPATGGPVQTAATGSGPVVPPGISALQNGQLAPSAGSAGPGNPAGLPYAQPALLYGTGTGNVDGLPYAKPAGAGRPTLASPAQPASLVVFTTPPGQPAAAATGGPLPSALATRPSSPGVAGAAAPAATAESSGQASPVGPALLPGTPAAAATAPLPAPEQSGPAKPKKKFKTGLELPAADSRPSTGAEPEADAKPETAGVAGLPGYDARGLMETVSVLFQSWRSGKLRLSSRTDDQSVDQALTMLASAQLNLPAGTALSEADKGRFTHNYLPMFTATPSPNTASLCKGTLRMTQANIPVALAWLDILSTTAALSLKSFGLEQQEFILEVALSPSHAAACVRGTAAEALVNASLYIGEAKRNPDFINFLARDLPRADLGVSGINLLGTKFISTRTGDKMREGSAPDGESRVAVVGELGLAIRIRAGFAINVYGPELNWRDFSN